MGIKIKRQNDHQNQPIWQIQQHSSEWVSLKYPGYKLLRKTLNLLHANWKELPAWAVYTYSFPLLGLNPLQGGFCPLHANSSTQGCQCPPSFLFLLSWWWERWKAGGEGDDRGWDGWMTSLTRWTWVWASSRSWWWTGKPGMLQSMGSQRVRHNWVTELNVFHAVRTDSLPFHGSGTSSDFLDLPALPLSLCGLLLLFPNSVCWRNSKLRPKALLYLGSQVSSSVTQPQRQADDSPCK